MKNNQLIHDNMLKLYNLTIQSAFISLYFDRSGNPRPYYTCMSVDDYLKWVIDNVSLENTAMDQLYKRKLYNDALNPLQQDRDNDHNLLYQAEFALLNFLQNSDSSAYRILREMELYPVNEPPIILFRDKSIPNLKKNKERIKYISSFYYNHYELLFETIRKRKSLRKEYMKNGGYLMTDIIITGQQRRLIAVP